MIDEYVVDYEEYPAIGSGGITYLGDNLFVNTFSVNDYNAAIAAGRMSLMGKTTFSKRDRMRYRFMMQLFGLRLDKVAWERDFGCTVEAGLPVEMAFMKASGAFDRDTRDELTLTPKGRYLMVVMMRQFFIGVNNLRDQARAALTGIAQVLLCSREAPMRTLVQGILREANVQILGGEEQTTSYAEFTAYEQLFGLKLQPAQNLIRSLRAAKQPEELAMMYQAQQITDETFAQICTVIRPGMTEREIAAELIYRMLRLGAEGTSFDPIVLTGPDTSMPHGVPGDRRVAAGDFVTMDFGCRKNGYCSDMTRTVAVGMPSDEMRSVYQIVLNAQLAGIAAAKAGVTGERVDAAARKVISDAGYGAYFGHSFGHSLGLDIHEHPIAAPGVHAKLPEHTVISAEPGIYLPGKFGVRIEDVMHLTADGAEILTRSPKNLIIL